MALPIPPAPTRVLGPFPPSSPAWSPGLWLVAAALTALGGALTAWVVSAVHDLLPFLSLILNAG